MLITKQIKKFRLALGLSQEMRGLIGGGPRHSRKYGAVMYLPGQIRRQLHYVWLAPTHGLEKFHACDALMSDIFRIATYA